MEKEEEMKGRGKEEEEEEQVSVQKQKTFGEVLRTAELGTSDTWSGATSTWPRADFQYEMEKHQLNCTFGCRYLKLFRR